MGWGTKGKDLRSFERINNAKKREPNVWIVKKTRKPMSV